jgi:excinuclease ABC subunit B
LISIKIDDTLTKSAVSSYHYDNAKQVAAEQDLQYLPKEEIEKRIRQKRKHMEAAAKELDFIEAARFRDEIKMLQQKKENQKV